MHPRYLEAWERSPIISLWPWLYHFPYDEFVLVFKVFLCLSNGTIVSFLSLFKKKVICSTFLLPSYLFILPSHVSKAPHGHILLQSFFAACRFSEQI